MLLFSSGRLGDCGESSSTHHIIASGAVGGESQAEPEASVFMQEGQLVVFVYESFVHPPNLPLVDYLQEPLVYLLA